MVPCRYSLVLVSGWCWCCDLLPLVTPEVVKWGVSKSCPGPGEMGGLEGAYPGIIHPLWWGWVLVTSLVLRTNVISPWLWPRQSWTFVLGLSWILTRLPWTFDIEGKGRKEGFFNTFFPILFPLFFFFCNLLVTLIGSPSQVGWGWGLLPSF